MSTWKLALLGLLALALKAGLAMVPQLVPLADPLLVVAVFSALGGQRWLAMGAGLLAGGMEDALFGQWLGLHAFSQMTIAFSLALIAARVDLLQPAPALLAVALASLCDWGVQVGLAALFNRPMDVVPGPLFWLAAVVLNTIIAFLFLRLASGRRRGGRGRRP